MLICTVEATGCGDDRPVYTRCKLTENALKRSFKVTYFGMSEKVINGTTYVGFL